MLSRKSNWHSLTRLASAISLFCLALLCSTTSDAFEVRPFRGDEITGNDVLAIWQFQLGDELIDGKGAANLELFGKSQVVPDNTFGGALDCHEYIKEHDKPHGARIARATAPLVDGPFSIEAWVKLKDTTEWIEGYILDKMYVPHTREGGQFNKDYFFKMRHNKNAGTVHLQAGIGLGAEVINFASEPFAHSPGAWRLMAFYYDGAGTGMFFLDGRMIGKKTFADKGGVAPGSYHISLGERCGSTYSGLPGHLAQVRLVKGLPSQIKLISMEMGHAYERTVFERMEKGQTLQLQIGNLAPEKISNLQLTINDGVEQKTHTIANLPVSNEPTTLELPLPTDAKAGSYTYTVTATGKNAAGKTIDGQVSFAYQLCRRLPEYMPVVMWGYGSVEQLKSTGFTHGQQWLDHLDLDVWKAGNVVTNSNRYADIRKELNRLMAEELRVMAKMSPGSYFKSQAAYAQDREKYLGVDRQGKPTKGVDMALPDLQQFAFNAARTMADHISMYPAVDIILTDSEFRDGSQLSFRPENIAPMQAATGLTAVPEEITNKSGVKYARLENFPASRIIPDDHPILKYYSWVWGEGDGYPGFLTQAWRGLTYNGAANWKVLWDPVVRCPSKWGSGGGVDWIGHWTYTYPDPLVMGFATDEVMAMGKGGPSYQDVTKMTQIIWYRSSTTGPMPEDVNKRAEWEKRLPDTKFITIAPDILEIALWQKISRPVKAILYHGAGSLWDKGKAGGYDFTHPGAQPRLAHLTQTVIKPFGPMLLKVPERQAQITLLESFTSQMFNGGITYGNMTNPVGRMHGALVRAHLQPEIIYDETIIRDGLDQFKVLVMPICAVLSQGVADRIKTWQAQGGIVVGDERLAPGITPDVLVPQLLNNEKESLIECAQLLRRELGDFCKPFAESDNADAVLRMRSYGKADYLFAFNDKRTFGDYVGQYKKVMEQGLPLDAKIQVNRPSGTVYDLLAGRSVPTKAVAGGLEFAVSFGPGAGQLYLITEHALRSVNVAIAQQVKRGQQATLEVTVLDASGQPADAVVPLQISGTDATGAPLEIHGWYAAVGGKLTLPIDVARNDVAGNWKIQVRELASGLTGNATVAIQ